MSKIESPLNTQFGTTVAKYRAFDSATNQTDVEQIKKLIETYSQTHKMIFEIMINNKKLKFDLDSKSTKEKLFDQKNVVSKVFVLEKIAKRKNMAYFTINEQLIDHLNSNSDAVSVNADIMATLKQYDEFDSDFDYMVVSKVMPKLMRLDDLLFEVDKSNPEIFATSNLVLTTNNNICQSVRIIGHTLYVVPSINLIKSKITELTDGLFAEMDDVKLQFVRYAIDVLKKFTEAKADISKLTFEYKIQYMFFD
jgi:hypothetical protein